LAVGGEDVLTNLACLPAARVVRDVLRGVGMDQWLGQWGASVIMGVALTVIPATGWAQNCPNVNISVNPVVPRFSPGGDTAAHLSPARPPNLDPDGISYDDCKSDLNLQFTLLISGLPCTDTIQVWAGTVDCTQVSARQADSGATHCWPVTPTGSFTMASTSTGNIRAQDIVEFVANAEPPEIYAPGDVKSCQSLAKIGPAPCGGVALGLYFMAIEADGTTVDGTSGEYELGAIDTLPDGGSCTRAADGGATDSSTTDTSSNHNAGLEGGGCQTTPGQGSGVGVFAGMGVAAMVIGKRRRRIRRAARA
jgi:hypothetical protein